MATNLGMTSPQTASSKNVTELLQRVYENKAVIESVKPDPLMGNKDLIKPIDVVDRQAVPMMDSIMVDITPKNTGARSITLAFIKGYSDDPIEGNTQFIGNEMDTDLKWSRFYANDWSGGAIKQMFGIDYRELKNYGINESVKARLMQWRSEILGYYARQAVIRNYSNNLTAAPISLTQGYNKNWWFPSVSDGSQPSYSATAATFASTIGAAAMSAGAGAILSPSYLLELIDYLENSYIEAATIAGSPKWVMMTAPREIRRLRDPGVTDSFGDLYVEAANVKGLKDIIPDADLVVADSLILVRDARIPTMTVAGNASAYTLGFGFEKAGRSTTRTSSVSTVADPNYWYTNLVLGKMALAIYEPEKTHNEKQDDEYKQYEGDALFQAIGFSTPEWNLDSASQSDSTAQQETSMIVPTCKR